MITLHLTESEAARIAYALEAEAAENNRKAWDEKKNGAFSVASGRAQILHETARDEALGIVRRISEYLS